MRVKIAACSQETGALLLEYLKARGVPTQGGMATLCYGVPTAKRPALNERCGQGKLNVLNLMRKGGVRTIPWWDGEGRMPEGMTFPLLARNNHGYGGTDIVPVFQPDELEWRKQAGFSWFSQYIPVATEYRVWVFRDQVLDVYEKVMRRPEDYKFIGRNFRNGFDFTLQENPGGYLHAVLQAKKAVRAIGLDFAAVDVLKGLNGNVYVLEANTAPGVIRSGAQATLGKLADCITKWERDGYPDRPY